jgi:hypothetical protein
MYAFSKLLSVSHSYEDLMGRVIPALAGSGWQVMQTFDLRTASGMGSQCSCPHHGTDLCSCQMAVYLVYSLAAEDGLDPMVLVLHGRDGYAELGLAESRGVQAQAKLAAAIREALRTSASPSMGCCCE